MLDFSRLDLTDASAKMPTMAGIARTFAAKLRDIYKAGLWIGDFRTGLLWRHKHDFEATDPSLTQTLTRHPNNGYPSWSWASVTGCLTYDPRTSHPPEPMTEMIMNTVDITEEQPGAYGKDSGRILGKGLLRNQHLLRNR
ncbi:hypothetical protein B0H67DRAFT_102397 [Lasiosphaeris hirsuta]|uniref:Uncharacterized protein n=1 Tax=Lasiosphaeris hirsuta TaxID=260670 RepID=A0AA40AYH7_9PEZI|nr:hypothetical protein B0H67DRAFT_102397 [Lasiosphaeris hirsuta]